MPPSGCGADLIRGPGRFFAVKVKSSLRRLRRRAFGSLPAAPGGLSRWMLPRSIVVVLCGVVAAGPAQEA